MYKYSFAAEPAFFAPQLFKLFIFLCVFDALVKGYALWKAGRNGQSYWFVALFILNTLGILPLLYIGFFQKNRVNKKK